MFRSELSNITKSTTVKRLSALFHGLIIYSSKQFSRLFTFTHENVEFQPCQIAILQHKQIQKIHKKRYVCFDQRLPMVIKSEWDFRGTK